MQTYKRWSSGRCYCNILTLFYGWWSCWAIDFTFSLLHLCYLQYVWLMNQTSRHSTVTFSITRPVVSQLMRTPRSQCKLCGRNWGLEGNGYKVLHIVYRRQSNIDQHSRLMMSMTLEVIIISVKCQDDDDIWSAATSSPPQAHRGGLAHCTMGTFLRIIPLYMI